MSMSSNTANTEAPPPPANRGALSALGAFLATAMLALVPLEQSQAQIYIDVYPSQDNPTSQTLWIFSGSSTADRSLVLFSVTNFSQGTIRTSSGNTYDDQDSARFSSNPFNANSPNNLVTQLNPLLTSTNTADINSVLSRIPGGGKTNITFAATATNTPMITIGANSNQTISHLFMHATSNAVGPRVTTAFTYGGSALQAMNWHGAGLINKPIGDFNAGTFGSRTPSNAGTFFSRSANTFSLRVHSTVIPEPEEYALIFGLFALGFVILRRHWQKKQTQQATAS